MTRRVHTILTSLLLLQQLVCHAQTGTIKAGAVFSPKASGVSLSYPARDNGTTEILLLADLGGVISGKAEAPGIRGEYRKWFIIGGFLFSDGLAATVSYGPGLAAGLVRDRDEDYGLMAGLTGGIKASFWYGSGVVIETRFSADFACHIIYDDKYRNTLKLYRNGLQRIYMPEIAIKYRF